MGFDFKQRTIINKLINFNELRIFETAKGQHNLITILRKNLDPEFIAQTSMTQRKGDANSKILNSILYNKDEKTNYFFIKQSELYEGNENYIRLSGLMKISTNPIEKLLNKLTINSIPLVKIKNINQGLLTGADKVTEKHIDKFKYNNISKREGIFVLSDKEIKNLNLSKEEEKIIKPFYKNSDVSQYFTNSIENKKNLIYLTRDLNIKDYPNIQKHIIKYEKIIKARSQERGEMQAALKLGKWWVIFAARPGVDFDGPKIVCPQRSLLNSFGYNEEPWYASADIYYITDIDEDNKIKIELKYILSLLNSGLYFAWLYYRGKRKGELLELLYQPLSEIPIKQISPEQQKPFIQLVDQILSITKDNNYLDNSDKQAKVKKLEKEIDQLVYKLYELTPEEIKIVEEFKGGK